MDAELNAIEWEKFLNLKRRIDDIVEAQRMRDLNTSISELPKKIRMIEDKEAADLEKTTIDLGEEGSNSNLVIFNKEEEKEESIDREGEKSSSDSWVLNGEEAKDSSVLKDQGNYAEPVVLNDEVDNSDPSNLKGDGNYSDTNTIEFVYQLENGVLNHLEKVKFILELNVQVGEEVDSKSPIEFGNLKKIATVSDNYFKFNTLRNHSLNPKPPDCSNSFMIHSHFHSTVLSSQNPPAPKLFSFTYFLPKILSHNTIVSSALLWQRFETNHLNPWVDLYSNNQVVKCARHMFDESPEPISGGRFILINWYVKKGAITARSEGGLDSNYCYVDVPNVFSDRKPPKPPDNLNHSMIQTKPYPSNSQITTTFTPTSVSALEFLIHVNHNSFSYIDFNLNKLPTVQAIHKPYKSPSNASVDTTYDGAKLSWFPMLVGLIGPQPEVRKWELEILFGFEMMEMLLSYDHLTEYDTQVKLVERVSEKTPIITDCAVRTERDIVFLNMVTCMELDVFVTDTLVVPYVKCGDFWNLKKLCYRYIEQNIVSWNAVFLPYTRDEYSMEASRLFRDMGIKLWSYKCRILEDKLQDREDLVELYLQKYCYSSDCYKGDNNVIAKEVFKEAIDEYLEPGGAWFIQSGFETIVGLYEQIYGPNLPRTQKVLECILNVEIRYRMLKEQHKDNTSSNLLAYVVTDNGKGSAIHWEPPYEDVYTQKSRNSKSLVIYVKIVIFRHSMLNEIPLDQQQKDPPPPSQNQNFDNHNKGKEEERDEDDRNDEYKQHDQLPKKIIIDVKVGQVDEKLGFMERQAQRYNGKAGRSRDVNFSQHRSRHMIKLMLHKYPLKRLAADATLRATAPYQKLHRYSDIQNIGAVLIKNTNMRVKGMGQEAGILFLIVVNGSESMASNQMKNAKGVALKLFDQVVIVSWYWIGVKKRVFTCLTLILEVKDC